MATTQPTEENYEEIDRPYNQYLERSDLSNTDPAYLSSGSSASSNATNSGNLLTNNNGATEVLDGSIDNGSVETQPVKSDGGMADLWITNLLRSTNWKPKKVGFMIDGSSGYAEFTNVYVSGNIQALTGSVGGFEIGADYIKDTGDMFGMASTITGGNDVRFWAGASYANRGTAPFRVYEDGSLAGTGLTITRIDLPDLVTPSSFHVDTAGNTWWGATTLAGSVGSVLATGAATFSSISINGGVIDATSTIGGRISSTLASAIDVSGHFIDTAINTATKSILDGFTFGASGAIQIGTYVNGVSGDIKISPSGILGRNSAGSTTFSINGTTGVAVLNGLVVGTNVGIGTAQDYSGVTTIIGNTVNTGYVNALYVTAGSVSANNITAGTITGSLLRTASYGMRVEIGSVVTGTITFYDSSGNSCGGIFGNGSYITVKGETGISLNVGSSYGTLIGLISSSGLIMSSGMAISNTNGKLFIPVGYNMF